jgi:hypothetical protein
VEGGRVTEGITDEGGMNGAVCWRSLMALPIVGGRVGEVDGEMDGSVGMGAGSAWDAGKEVGAVEGGMQEDGVGGGAELQEGRRRGVGAGAGAR